MTNSFWKFWENNFDEKLDSVTLFWGFQVSLTGVQYERDFCQISFNFQE